VRNAEPGLRHEGVQTRRQCASVVSPCRHGNRSEATPAAGVGIAHCFSSRTWRSAPKAACAGLFSNNDMRRLDAVRPSARRTASVCDRDGQPYARGLLSLGRRHPRRVWRCEWLARFASRWVAGGLGAVAARAGDVRALVLGAVQSAVSTVALALRVMVCVPQGRQKHTVPGSSVRNKTAG
jgi:hypothetical protein